MPVQLLRALSDGRYNMPDAAAELREGRRGVLGGVEGAKADRVLAERAQVEVGKRRTVREEVADLVVGDKAGNSDKNGGTGGWGITSRLRGGRSRFSRWGCGLRHTWVSK